MAVVRILQLLTRDKKIGPHIVPIVPDESRTFGMEGMFRRLGIYSSVGQLYEPMDSDQVSYYREDKKGQILQEGINEAGAMCSWIAAGTCYATSGINMVPFYIYYSMFGFQRTHDLAWAAGDMQARGFLLGGTAGRTTLAGEGLQHQDGHSHILSATIPNCRSYDPTYAYELAVIIQDGLRRMFVEQEDVFYYLTVYNENYAHPAMPAGAEQGILRGIYRFKSTAAAQSGNNPAKIHLFGSGSIMQQVLGAQAILAENGFAADVWSVSSYNLLYRDAIECEEWNRTNPAETPREPYLTKALAGASGVFVAASDYMKVLPASIAQWVPGTLVCLGTDGFGLSESRSALREHFGISSEQIARAARDAIADN